MLSVAVEDEAPDGTVSRLSGGWQVISDRALDPSRSRYLDGQLVQPYHPFTKATAVKLTAGQVAPVDVEIFPTGAQIQPGHRLRVAVQAFDVPHLLPTLTDLLGTLTVLRIHASTQYPSTLTLPVLGANPAGSVAPAGSVGPAARSASRTTASLRHPARRHHAVRVRAVVTSAGAVTGRVRFRWDGHLLTVRTLRDGRAVARVPARWATHGRHRLVVRYLGSGQVAPSSTRLHPRVR